MDPSHSASPDEVHHGGGHWPESTAGILHLAVVVVEARGRLRVRGVPHLQSTEATLATHALDGENLWLPAAQRDVEMEGLAGCLRWGMRGWTHVPSGGVVGHVEIVANLGLAIAFEHADLGMQVVEDRRAHPEELPARGENAVTECQV